MSSGLININCYKYPWENTSIPERIQVSLREYKYPWENTSIPERMQVSLREYKYPWENTSIPERIQVSLREYKYPWENKRLPIVKHDKTTSCQQWKVERKKCIHFVLKVKCGHRWLKELPKMSDYCASMVFLELHPICF
jgi:hypothetical protein